MRFQSTEGGRLCKTCIGQQFWKTTAINLTLGWWGIISFFMTPIFLIWNVATYSRTGDLAPVPPYATVPHLSFEEIQRLEWHGGEIVQRLSMNEPFESVAGDVGRRAGVTDGQVALYVENILGPRLQAGALTSTAPATIVASPSNAPPLPFDI